MADRKGIKKSVRFEVFKRDSFTCQYCGRSAPNVILHVDHIMPVAKGGEDDITNLVTSCVDCNLGKSDRELTDDAAIQKRKKQLDELQERRDQLEMMMEWQRGLVDLEGEVVNQAAFFWADLVRPYSLTEPGLAELRKTIKKHGLSETLESMRASAAQYLKQDDEGKYTQESVMKAWEYVARICNARKHDKERPYMKDLYYIRGIMRNRYHYVNDWQAIATLESAYLRGAEIDDLKQIALEESNWTGWRSAMDELLTEKQEV
jgi:hypothetical protein